MFTCGLWESQHKTLPIDILELQALLEAIQLWGHQLQHRHVRVLTDSIAMYYLLRAFSNTTSELWCRIVKLHKLLKLWSIAIAPQWLPSHANHRADDLSTSLSSSDWIVSESLYLHMDLLFGPHSLDVFADAPNNKVPDFCSWLETNSWGGGLQVSWQGKNNWMPPLLPPSWGLLQRVAARVEQHFLEGLPLKVIILTPHWPSTP